MSIRRFNIAAAIRIRDKGRPALPRPPFIILVTGGRAYADRERLNQTLDALHREHRFTRLVHGGARGADTLAGEWAVRNDVPMTVYPADWSMGRGAGHIRNAEMLAASNPHLVVAFPGGRGTAGMVKLALRAGKEVLTVNTGDDDDHWD